MNDTLSYSGVSECKLMRESERVNVLDDRVHQECRGEGGVPAGVCKCGEGTQCHPGGAPQNENGHQGSGGQPRHRERGEESVAFVLTTFPH